MLSITPVNYNNKVNFKGLEGLDPAHLEATFNSVGGLLENPAMDEITLRATTKVLDKVGDATENETFKKVVKSLAAVGAFAVSAIGFHRAFTAGSKIIAGAKEAFMQSNGGKKLVESATNKFSEIFKKTIVKKFEKPSVPPQMSSKLTGVLNKFFKKNVAPAKGFLEKIGVTSIKDIIIGAASIVAAALTSKVVTSGNDKKSSGDKVIIVEVPKEEVKKAPEAEEVGKADKAEEKPQKPLSPDYREILEETFNLSPEEAAAIEEAADKLIQKFTEEKAT